ncbi:hypothetical protein DM02DRAFT_693476 [Periconia macrospinosa]|uniref:Uncharacterized protein n=1 Tax=Periconia macrospinosa TaxID=97972 RepID=A0A2V1D845_9PLEO|nr:hypothetical protein DM02DRAFT_693476 [Periconia macrospinosa]
MAAGSQLMRISMSQRLQPRGVCHAAIQWVRGRRGRVFVLSMLLGLIILILGCASNAESISTSYQALSSNYQLPSWRSHTAHLPAYFTSPLKPSNTSLELENNESGHIPSHLNKATPNFHLVMPATEDGVEFCKTTLSAMILNYPPPTIVGLNEKFESAEDKEKARLSEIHRYLTSEKLVNDEDMMLIVDGRDTWFQLPSDVLIRQYQHLLEDVNARLLRLYGDRFKQTIVFGATKTCERDVACQHMPEPMLPSNIYGPDTGKEIRMTPARYLDSTMLMGPVKDLRRLYQEAVQVMEAGESQTRTVQSVMATIFAKQEMARDKHRKKYKITHATNILYNWFDTSIVAVENSQKETEGELTLQEDHEYEMMIGLDYAHTLFQPFENCAKNELLSLFHDESVDLSKHHHKGTPTPPLTIPIALHDSIPPYWTPDFSRNNPSPNEKPVYIDRLEYQEDIDKLPNRETPWESTSLVQNTYTGTIPALFRIDDDESAQLPGLTTADTPASRLPLSSNISWTSFWYAGYERALLRNYFRIPQSSVGYHNVAVGGDRLWDQRGGRGGIWTAKEGLWLPWGEVDGVCGSLELLKAVFTDGKGVWLHETEGELGEEERIKEEKEYHEAIEKKKKEQDELEQEQREETQGQDDDVVADSERKEKEKGEERERQRILEEQQERERLERERQEEEEQKKKKDMEMEKVRLEQQQKQQQEEEYERVLGDRLSKWKGKMEESYGGGGGGG